MFIFFFFNDTATTEIYTLSLHDALPISGPGRLVRPLRAGHTRSPHGGGSRGLSRAAGAGPLLRRGRWRVGRSEEHTSELQSRQYLVCRLLLEKKKKKAQHTSIIYIMNAR